MFLRAGGRFEMISRGDVRGLDGELSSRCSPTAWSAYDTVYTQVDVIFFDRARHCCPSACDLSGSSPPGGRFLAGTKWFKSLEYESASRCALRSVTIGYKRLRDKRTYFPRDTLVFPSPPATYLKFPDNRSPFSKYFE